MKKILMITASVLLLMTFIPSVNAQEEEASKWNAGLDIYSSYIWRGLKFGTGAAFQPSVDFTAGGLQLAHGVRTVPETKILKKPTSMQLTLLILARKRR